MGFSTASLCVRSLVFNFKDEIYRSDYSQKSNAALDVFVALTVSQPDRMLVIHYFVDILRVANAVC